MDFVRSDHLSCYCYTKIKTKNIDKLANEVVLFRNVICQALFTPASHASILTAMYFFQGLERCLVIN